MRGRCIEVLREQRGMALLLVLCLFALLTALGASMFFASASALGDAVQSSAYQQAGLSASSFGDVVRRELEKPSSALKSTADGLGEKAEVKFSADLPDRMGSVEGIMRRTRKNYLAVQITATYREQQSVINIGFNRNEETHDVVKPGGATETVTQISWKLSRYSPKL